MSSDQIIAARVTAETKARFRALAEKRHLSESALLKRLLELTLDAAGDAPVRPLVEQPKVPRGARLYVRLRHEDHLLLAERAEARGMPAATYVSVLVRAHLRHLTPLPKDELLALKRSTAELGAVGRLLNQIARLMHQGTSAPDPHLRITLGGMLKICEALRDHTKATLRANLRSWEDGHEP
jgi:hypothetical protein